MILAHSVLLVPVPPDEALPLGLQGQAGSLSSGYPTLNLQTSPSSLLEIALILAQGS